jgi:lysophospholipase L1-like esterase
MKSVPQRLARVPLLLCILCMLGMQGTSDDPDPQRFESEIRAFREWDARNSHPQDAVLFVGSSTIRMWKTRESFPQWPVINRGFGGAHISDVIHYAPQIVLPYKARVIVLYAGDNDIAAGKRPERVLSDFKRLVQLIRRREPETPVVFLSIKPSVARREHWPRMREANSLIHGYCEYAERLFYVDTATAMLDHDSKPREEMLIQDGLHLSDVGYAVWTREARGVIGRALRRAGD